MKILCGQYAADTGEVIFDQSSVRPTDPLDAERLGLVMIHQELNLVPGLTVAQNIFLGHEPTTGGLISDDRMSDGAIELLRRLSCDVEPERPVSELSVAQQQLVEIARALQRNARLLVMDEPSAALSDVEIEALFGVIRDLASDGVPVIYISHRMPEIFAIGDRVTVMRDGLTVGTRSVRDTEVAELIRLMVGRSIAERVPKRNVPLGDVVLEVEKLSGESLPESIDLTVRRGEILGIAGLMGSGRTELARAIFGADPIDGGTVTVAGRTLSGHGPADSIEAGMGFLTEDRKQLGLVLQCTVTENISLTSLDEISTAGVIDLAAETEVARAEVDRLHIRLASLEQEVVNLSGGNQQKVVLARWLAARCRVLLFDEPTRGIDVGAKAEIYDLIGELVGQGVAILLISSEMPELLGLSDRVAVMHDGVMQGVLSRDEATQERIMELALKLNA
jgi:ribose transport system ATP-binding protein